MAAIIKQQFRTENAANFVASFTTNPTYMMIGQTRPWVASSEYPTASDTTPPTPEDTYSQIFRTFKGSIAAKRIQANDVIQGVSRFNWVTGTAYIQYDSEDQALFGKAFYVMTPSFKVYKCLFNNFGGLSTVEPTGTSTAHFTTADGYVWKYMYSISTGSVLKFLNDSFIPVESDSVVSAASVVGQIFSAVVVDGGSGYTNGSQTCTITGNGTGATAVATVVSGVITKITITAVGSGYTYATLSVAGGTGFVGYVNLAPIGGHGKNVYDELGGFYTIAAVSLTATEGGDFSVLNDYRSISMLRNPLASDNITSFVGTTANMTTRVNVVSSTGFVVDSKVTVGAVSAYIVEVGVGYLLVNDIFGTMPSSGSIIGDLGGSTTITSLVQPEIYTNSGKILYIEQRTPIQRAAGQTETIRVIFEY
jgi:hypothetical protein